MPLRFTTPLHPGDYLREEFLVPLDMTAGMLARRLGVPRTRIERLVSGRGSLSADTAIRLGRFFKTTPQFWMNFQQAYDLEIEALRLGARIDDIQPLTDDEGRRVAA